MHSSRLADALARIDGVEPVILAGRADEHRSVPEESPHEVHDVAKIGLWRDDEISSLDVELVAALDLDVIHVQYQSMLFRQESLGALRALGLPIAVTYHDNCQAPTFPYGKFDLHFSHRSNVGPTHLPNCEVIPFGIEDRPPVVRSFGLGRHQADLIAPICERNGWVYEDASTHEPIQGGGQAWRTHEDLIGWLRGADAIVIWYADNGMAGSSQAARTAMASRRPVVTNATTWFEDLPPVIGGVYAKAPDLDALELHLRDIFARPYVEANSWDRVARLLVDRYSAVRASA